MVHDSYLFDFQGIINNIREKTKDKKMQCSDLLDNITEKTEFEDMPIYKEYLSSFNVKDSLAGWKLNFPPELQECEEDFFVLLQLVAGSFSSNYSLEYVEANDTVDLIITVQNDDAHITKRLRDLWSFQIANLFEIYIEEQLNFEGLRGEMDREQSGIDSERKMKLLVFQKKIRQLKSMKDSGGILTDMDDLLNS